MSFAPTCTFPPPAGAGRGCKLNLTDLVAVGILHNLFIHGVKFQDLTIHGASGGPPLGSSPVVFEGFLPRGNRPMQEYLDRHDHYVFVDCEVTWNKDRLVPQRLIMFMPESGYHSVSQTLKTNEKTCDSHLFINARKWRSFIMQRLAQGN